MRGSDADEVEKGQWQRLAIAEAAIKPVGEA